MGLAQAAAKARRDFVNVLEAGPTTRLRPWCSIEALWNNSEPTILLDGSCVVGSERSMQDATVLSFKETFDEWPNLDNFQVVGVNYNPETGIIGVQYEEWVSDQTTIEFWQGCEFIDNTDWWERGYDDGPFDVTRHQAKAMSNGSANPATQQS